MERLIAIARGDGGVTVLRVLPRLEKDGLRPATDEEVAREVQAQGPSVSHGELTPDRLPANRLFRDAWTYTGASVAVRMPEARLIHLDSLRRLRDAKLASLDVEYQKADEAGNQAEKQRIAARKQHLRDMPTWAMADMNNIHTPERLAEYLPPELTNP